MVVLHACLSAVASLRCDHPGIHVDLARIARNPLSGTTDPDTQHFFQVGAAARDGFVTLNAALLRNDDNFERLVRGAGQPVLMRNAAHAGGTSWEQLCALKDAGSEHVAAREPYKLNHSVFQRTGWSLIRNLTWAGLCTHNNGRGLAAVLQRIGSPYVRLPSARFRSVLG